MTTVRVVPSSAARLRARMSSSSSMSTAGRMHICRNYSHRDVNRALVQYQAMAVGFTTSGLDAHAADDLVAVHRHHLDQHRLCRSTEYAGWRLQLDAAARLVALAAPAGDEA